MQVAVYALVFLETSLIWTISPSIQFRTPDMATRPVVLEALSDFEAIRFIVIVVTIDSIKGVRI